MKLKKYISIILASVMLLACVPGRAEQEDTPNTDWIQQLREQLDEPSEPEPTPEPPNTVYYDGDIEITQPSALEKPKAKKYTEVVPYEIFSEESADEPQFPQPGNPAVFASVQNELWKSLFTTEFGDDYLMPYKKNNDGQNISGKTNRLVIEETDLTLPGKNGLDVNIIRRHDNQDYNNTYYGISGANTVDQIRYCYRFINQQNGQSFYVAFLTEDNMYTYMYNNCYVTQLDENKMFSRTLKENTDPVNCYYFEDIYPYLTQDSYGIQLTYDASAEQEILWDEKKGGNYLGNRKQLTNPISIGNGWKLVLPEIYMSRTAHYTDGSTQTDEFSGAFRERSGAVNSFSGEINAQRNYDGSTTITSTFTADDNYYLNAQCFYEQKQLDGNGPEYNFVFYDSRGLTYYFYDTNIIPGSNTIATRHPMKIVAIEDDYGNQIQYKYADGYSTMTSIIDTYGREIQLNRVDADHFQICYMDENNREKVISYTNEQLPANTLQNGSPLEGKPVNRFTITNEAGDQTIYDSRETMVLSYYGAYLPSGIYDLPNIKSLGEETSVHSNIERIIYPTGAETNYQYRCIYPANRTANVNNSVYAVEKKWDVVDHQVVNQMSYTFNGVESIRVTEVQDHGEESPKTITNSSYNKKGLLVEEITSSNGSTNVDSYSHAMYQYDDENNITRKTVLQNNVSQRSDYEYYPYTHRIWEEITGDKRILYTYHEVNSEPTDKIKNIHYEYKTGYTYKTDYSIITDLTPDQKAIEYSRTVKDGAIQNQVRYEYDAEGNVTATHQWTGDTNKDNVLDMNDDVITLNSAYTTTPQKTVNITNEIPSVKNIDGQDEGAASAAYEFNIYGYPTSQIDSYGTETKIDYDSVNRPIKYTFANGGTRTVEYNTPQNYTIVTDEAGVRSKNIYDGLGRISYKQLKDGNLWRTTAEYTYDPSGRISQTVLYRNKAGEGTKEEYTYDELNRISTKTVYELPNNKLYSEKYRYGVTNTDVKLQTIKKTTVAEDGSPTADQTEYYDNLGRKIKTTVGDITTSYGYDYLDRCISQTDPNGNTTTTEYNTAGQVIKTTNAAGDSTTNTYDMVGQLISQTDPKGNAAFYTYDKMGNKIQDLTPFGTNNNGKTKYFYDKNANLIRQDVVRGEAVSIITRYQYDAMGNLIAVTGNDGKKDSITQYEYDAANRMTRMVTGLTAMQTSLSGGTRYEYNALGYVSKVTDPLGQSEMYPEYDYAGNAQKYKDKNGNEICYEYGLYGLERQIVAGKNEEKNQKYTSLGQIQQSTVINTDGTASTEQYTYDAYGRLAAHTAGNAVQNYTYDKNSNIQTYTLSENGQLKNSIEYGYNTLNQLTELNANGIMTVYQYDKNGNLSNKKTGSDLTTTYEYNAGNLITRMVNQKGNQIYNDYECSYLRDGSKLIETDGAIMKGYTYDKMGRLSTEGAQRNMLEMEYSKSYDYDAAGNRIKSIQTDYDTDTRKVISYTYDGNNRMTGKSTLLADAPNSQTGEVTDYTNYFYDKNGNTTAEQTFAYTAGTQSTSSTIAGRSNGNSLKVYEYNAFNQLTAYSDSSNRATYQYNANGLRTKKTVNGQSTGFIWNGTNLAAETIKGSIANTYSYDITGIHSTNQNGMIGLYQKNPHGDVTSILNGSGTTLNTYDYDAFGNEFANEEAINNPFRYCGEYYDNESGNIYLRARYYNLSIGRFNTEDTYWNTDNMIYDSAGQPVFKYISQSSNLYPYCINNPIQYTDPSGCKIYVGDNQGIISDYLNTISRDTLEIDSYGYVYIKFQNKNVNDRPVGTELIYQLILNDNICSIVVGSRNQTSYNNIERASNGGTGTTVQINPYKRSKYRNETTGQDEELPIQISLGHELIHSLRAMKGNRKRKSSNNDKGTYTVNGKSMSEWQEELDTVGINHTRNNDGTYANAGEWYFTENSLRDEQGYGRRPNY